MGISKERNLALGNGSNFGQVKFYFVWLADRYRIPNQWLKHCLNVSQCMTLRRQLNT